MHKNLKHTVVAAKVAALLAAAMLPKHGKKTS